MATCPPSIATLRERESQAAQTKGGQEIPRARKFPAEEIIEKLCDAGVGLAQGRTVFEVVWKLGVTEQTHDRWKQECGGLRAKQAKRPKDLEKENARMQRQKPVGGSVHTTVHTPSWAWYFLRVT